MPSQRTIHPKILFLWLAMISITMTFAALSSAYLVKKGDLLFLQKLPSIFNYNTIIIILSSVTGQIAYKVNKKKFWLALTIILALFFLYQQYQAWQQLIALQIYFVGNPIGSFFYIFTGLHALHLISGILALLTMYIISLIKNIGILYWKINVHYWHFLTILWLYLYIFLLLNH